MNHLLTEQQIEVKRMIRDFAESEIRPSVTRRDRSCEFPADICRKLGELGFMGVNTAENFGGAGMDAVTYAIVVEEISRVDAAVGMIISVHNSMTCHPLEKYGTQQQVDTWLKPCAEGRLLGAFCLAEPDSGADVSAPQCTARRDGANYLLNGAKAFVTNGGAAGVFLVLARTETAADSSPNISILLVPRSTAGLTIGKPEKTMGVRSAGCVSGVRECTRTAGKPDGEGK